MTKKRKPPEDDPEQSERFVEAAKELEAGKDGGAFEGALGFILRPFRSGGRRRKNREKSKK